MFGTMLNICIDAGLEVEFKMAWSDEEIEDVFLRACHLLGIDPDEVEE